jgi:hypothetical protein
MHTGSDYGVEIQLDGLRQTVEEASQGKDPDGVQPIGCISRVSCPFKRVSALICYSLADF